jgi:hypothetical protein
MSVAAPKRPKSHPKQSTPVLTMETIGVLLIAILILAIMLARYWHFVHWSLR